MSSSREIVIGFSNLEERSAYAVAVRESLEAACQQHPNIRLICRDNAWDDERALENARYFVEQAVDVAIIYHINENLGPKIQSILMPIPIICIDIPISLTTYVGIDNEGMGQQTGQHLQTWLNDNWQGYDALAVGLIDSRARISQPRVVGVLDAIQQSDLNEVSSIFLDMRYSDEENIQTILDITQRETIKNRKIIFVAYNDPTARYALEVIQSQEIDGVVVCQGITADMIDMVQDPQHPLIMGTISHPEQYGDLLVDAALKMVQKNRSAANYHVPLTVIS